MSIFSRNNLIYLVITGLPTIGYAVNNSPNIDSKKITEILIFLALTLILILGLAFIAKKFRLTQKFSTPGFKITSSIPLTTKDKLIVVKTKRENILLGLSPGRISYLCHLDESEIEHEKITEKS